ncbi:MAG: N,N-dimethylformamidase beta subunit family domain-containing protein [Pseudomonadota bacterium]
MSVPWFYPDKVSAAPGDVVTLFASAEQSPCELIVRREGLASREVKRVPGIEVDAHAIPEHADRNGCGWPAACRLEIEADWTSGYYDLEMVDSQGGSTHHFICVRTGSSLTSARAVIILSTNTYTAYNYWGGSNAYADVEGLLDRKVSPDESRAGAIAQLSRMRPYPQNLIYPPEGVPRLVNYTPRGLNETPIPGDPSWYRQHRLSPYDGSACFMRKWEHVFVTWCEQHNIELDYLTDHDFLNGGEELLGKYACVLVVGHSDYWSRAQRNAIDDFVDGGGHLAVFSGNTCYWTVRWDEDGLTMVTYKTKGEQDDPVWANPDTRPEATHLWSHPVFEQPEAKLLGLSFLYGGYHRLAMCAARGAGGYTIYDDQHWSLEGADLFYGDVLGADLPLIGYENDGCLIQIGGDGLPQPGGVGVPENLEIIGLAPATLYESERSPYPKMIPKEDVEVLAQIAHGASDDQAVERLARGHAVMASFRRNEGEVFNAGTTEWVHGLDAGDPFVERITMNVLKRFHAA